MEQQWKDRRISASEAWELEQWFKLPSPKVYRVKCKHPVAVSYGDGSAKCCTCGATIRIDRI